MSVESRQIHKETATAIITGLMINFPLNFSLLYLWIDVLEWDSAFKIAICTTAIMTIVAYTRVYTIRRHFAKQNAKEIAETQI
jgi:hypothetical protein